MLATPAAKVLVGLAMLSATGCCRESQQEVTIAGTVTYADFVGGTITVILSENTSSRCGYVQTPGVDLATATLRAPGAFSMKGTICSTAGPPMLDLIAHLNDADTHACTAGAFIALPPLSTSTAKLDLTAGSCPTRK